MRVFVLALLATLLLSVSALAQAPDPPPWTDARVRSVAAERAPIVREARAALDRAYAGRVSGERPPLGNPTVGVMVLPGAPDFGAWTTALSVALPIEVSGVRGVWSREAERGVLAARARLSDVTLQAVTAARRARVELAVGRAQVDVQSARLASARETERRVRARVTAGAATAVDMALAERERAVAEAELAATRARELDALAVFRSALDLGHSDRVDVAPPERPARVDASALDGFVARAMQTRQDVSALEHDALRMDLSETRVGRSAVAPLSLGFEAQQVAVDQGLATSLGASLRWELPLIQRAQGDRATLRAEAQGARTSAGLLRRQVGRDVVRAAQALSLSLDELDALESRAIPAAERLVTASEAAFAAGALDYFRVLVAGRELLELRARALTALRAAWAARFEYERSVGATDDE